MKNTVTQVFKRLQKHRAADTLASWLLSGWQSTPWERYRHLRASLSFYSRFVRKGDLCFDVGANVGERTEAFRRLGASVIAVEPQKVCVQQLMNKYAGDEGVKIVAKALGEREGQAEMMASNASNLSSLSQKWIDSMRAHGLFTHYNWDTKMIVPVTTLDKLIAEYGQPAFCKIDVEGFEVEVLKGLSGPIKVISIEFHTALIDAAVDCVRRLSSLGMIWFNYSWAETMVLNLGGWVQADEMCRILESLVDKLEAGVYGDVYAATSLECT